MSAEILAAPMTMAAGRDLFAQAYKDGPYHMQVMRNDRMPERTLKQKATGNLGDLKNGMTKQTEETLLRAVKWRTQDMEKENLVIYTDAFTKFQKLHCPKGLHISYLQPGSEIMSMCPVKAEFWQLHLPVPVRNILIDTMNAFIATIPKEVGTSIAGITLAYRYVPESGVPAPTESTIGLMSIELSKMKWKSASGDSDFSQTVSEICVFKTSERIFGTDGQVLSSFTGGGDGVTVHFQSDFGQYVKPSLTNVKRLSKEDVSKFLKQYGFRSHLLELMSLNGARLINICKQGEDVVKLANVLSMPVDEVKRLQRTVHMIARRATPGRYIAAQARGKEIKNMRNATKIEFLPYIKPIKMRFNKALSLETEIRSTAEALLNKMFKGISAKNVVKVDGVNESWIKTVYTQELDSKITDE